MSIVKIRKFVYYCRNIKMHELLLLARLIKQNYDAAERHYL